MKRIKTLSIVSMVIFGSCQVDNTYKEILNDPEIFRSAMKKLTDVIVYDIFSPPVASRVYVYPNIAAYEVIRQINPIKYKSLGGQLTNLPKIPEYNQEQEVNFHLASIHAFLKLGQALIFSENKIETFRTELYDKLEENGLPRRIKKASIEYGEKVADHIQSWADRDMYNQTRTYPKYTIQSDESKWKPTPPDYMEGIEPHWREIRTMIIDSAGQFPPIKPIPFDLRKGSGFYNQLMEVYETVKYLNREQKEIAAFLDCNPYVSHHRGHAMFATKKITPGGHWMGICAIATRQAGSPFDETVEVYARISIVLFDAFISCWDEKWNSILVRPETLINQHLDEDWVPILQTPPFPEYTSGHSVISRAAAIMLTDYYGDNFAFTDTTEMEYGLPPRHFNSFLQASEEAAISRLYGGIHYMMAIENGVDQGEQIGNFVSQGLKTRDSL